MSAAAVHHESEPVAADRSEDREGVHGRVRSCVGCGERVDTTGNHVLVRLIISPAGEVAVDARGGGFGRGAHVHPRPDCLQKAVDRGIARSAKAQVNTLATETGELVPLSRAALAEAIKRSTDRRIEGLLLSAKRSHRLAVGADAVRAAWGRGDAQLILVARDAAAAADLTEVRQAVTEGRGAAWGTKAHVAALVHGPSRTEAHRVGVGVLAVSSRTIAAALQEAIHVADAVTGAPTQMASKSASKRGPSNSRSRSSVESLQEAASVSDQSRPDDSSAASACAPAPDGGKLRPRTVTMGSPPGSQGSPSRPGNRGERGRATFTRGRRPG